MEIKTKLYSFLAISLMTGSFLPIMLGFATSTNVFELFFLVFFVAIPFALFLLFKNDKTGKLMETIRNRKRLLIMSAVSILFFVPSSFAIGYSEHFVSAALATVIFRTSPLLMLALLPWLLSERLSRSQIIALSLGVVGIYIALTQGNTLPLFGGNTNLPILVFLILLTFGYAVATVLIKKYQFDAEVLILVGVLVNFMLFTALFILNGMPSAPISTTSMAVILYTAIISTVMAPYMYFAVVKSLKLSIGTNVYMLAPFITFVFAYFLLGEQIEPYYIAVAVLVTTGLVIQKFDTKGGAYVPRKKGAATKHMVMFDVSGAFIDTKEVAISKTLSSGGRVIAVKMPGTYKTKINSFIQNSEHTQIYTDASMKISKEVTFIKEIIGAQKQDAVIMKAGSTEENEEFFEDLNNKVISAD